MTKTTHDTLRGILLAFGVTGLIILSLSIVSIIVDIVLGMPALYAINTILGSYATNLDLSSLVWILPGVVIVVVACTLGYISAHAPRDTSFDRTRSNDRNDPTPFGYWDYKDTLGYELEQRERERWNESCRESAKENERQRERDREY